MIERIALIGNPNVGKSVVFGWLTGQYATVSNYPGTTVEITQGNCKIGGRRRVIVDTPGINNLIPMSEDERVTRDILCEDGEIKVIQVCDAKNLRRGLMITLQLAEMEKPAVLVLNMADEAQERGISIDHQGLSRILEIPVLSTVATRRKSLKGLRRSLEAVQPPWLRAMYGPEFKEGIAEIEELLPERQKGKRALAFMLLAGDESLREWLHARLSEEAVQRIEEICQRLEKQHQESLGFLIDRKRLNSVDHLLEGIFQKERSRQGRGAWLWVVSLRTPLGGFRVFFVCFT
jgi:ferrous iron transport protein B